LGGWNAAGSVPAPTVTTCDNFTGANGTNLAGRAVTAAATCGTMTWTVAAGTWALTGNRAGSTTGGTAYMSLPTTLAAVSVEANVRSVNAATRVGGVIANYDGVNTYLAAVLVNSAPQRVELRISVAGVVTVIASANMPLINNHRVRLSNDGVNYVVRVDGVTRLTGLLGGWSVPLGTNGRVGVISNATAVRFDDFLATPVDFP
jgi:hypothetical protein